MKLDRIMLFKVLNVVLIIISLTCGIALSIDSKKNINNSVLYISPKLVKSQYLFSENDAADITAYFSDVFVSYEAIENSMIEGGNDQAYTKIIYTNQNYKDVNYFNFVDGAFWTETGNWQNVAILSEMLAWKLFGTAYVVGNKVELNNTDFVVVGVVKQDKSSVNDYTAWTPLNAINAEDKLIENLYLLPEKYDKISSLKQAEQIPSYLGKNAFDYTITDVSQYVKGIENRYKILLFIIGCYFIIRIISAAYRLLRLHMRKKENAAALVIQLIFYMALVAVIWRYVYFEIGSQGYLQDFNDLLRVYFNVGVLSNANYLSDHLLRIKVNNDYANALFCMGILGVINFTFIHKPNTLSFSGGLYAKDTAEQI